MRIASLLAWLVGFATPAFCQTAIVGDAWITGQMGVGTSTPSARLEVKANSLTATVFQVSGVDETPFWTVGSSGAIGIGLSPSARLDMNGSGDSSVLGIELRDGNLYSATSSYQLTFGYNGSTNYRHAIRTSHVATQENNSIDFLIWNTNAGGTSSIATLNVASLVTSSTGSASLHILPVSTAPAAELEVSDGASIGNGTVHRLQEGQHSSRELKTNISYLGTQEELLAYQEVQGLLHARYRYKRLKKGHLSRDSSLPLRRGLIYEDSPESIRGPGGTINMDQRVVNIEMALKELLRRLDDMKAETDELRQAK